MIRRGFTILLTLLMSMMGIVAFAYNAKVDGIYYNFSGTEATVTYLYSSNSNYSAYSGNVDIPETVTYNGTTYTVANIGERAFYSCSGLTSVTIPNTVTSIGDNAFYWCSSLTCVTIPNFVTSIGNSAFCGCSGLTSVTIGNSVTCIGEMAFAYCSGLTEVKYNATNCTSMGSSSNRVFSGCSSLSTLNIGNNVQSIPSYAFYWCSGLTSVTIPNSVTSIGSSAFSDCSGLTSVTIPNSVTSIGDYTFRGCSGLTSVTIPNSVTSIGNYAFYQCSGLTSITIPNSVTSIGNYAFENCYSLESVTIGTGVLSISSYIFIDHLPAKVIWLTNTPPSGYWYAAGTTNYVANDLYTSLSNKTVYKYLSSMFEVDGVKYVPVSPSERTCDAIDCLYDENAENIHIGETVTNASITLKVNRVLPYVCYGNPYIKEVQLDLTGDVPNYAFSGCSKLEGIVIPNSITNIGQGAFSNCSSLSKMTIPQSVTNINNYAFSGCTQLKDVYIADRNTILTLGSNGSSPLFSSCPLDSVYIGGNISYNTGSSYGYSPFYRNTSLRSVTITDEETEISENEFYGCTNLKNVSIGDGVTTIGKWAFSGCSSLDYFAFGSSVTSIGQEAFSDCTAMTRLISHAATPPTCGSQALEDINIWTCHLEVPIGNAGAYAAADQWKDFLFVNEGDGTNQSYRITYIVDGVTYKVVSVAYGAAITPEPAPVKDGYTFSGWSELPETMPAQNLTVTGTFALDQQNSVTITAKSYTVQYGDPIPALGYSTTGAALNGTPELTCEATQISPVGTYVITASRGTVTNEDAAYVNGTLTIVKAPLTIKAGSYTKTQGEDNPTFTLTYEGFKNGETATALTRQAVASTLATKTSEPGQYRVTVSGAGSDNYDITYINGMLTITAALVNPDTDDVLIISDLSASLGATVTLPVLMENTDEITAFQFELEVPAGVTVTSRKLSTRKSDDHSLGFAQLPNGNYQFTAFSSNSTAFNGNTGTLVNVGLTVDGTMTTGQYAVKVKNIVLTTPNGEQKRPADVTANLAVSNVRLGDVNGDGTINITDAVGVVNYILGRPGTDFRILAADVNKDGTVNITDAVGIVNHILGRNVLASRGMTNELLQTSENTVSVHAVAIPKGGTGLLDITLTNSEGLSSYQMALTLPQGVTVSRMIKGSRFTEDEHMVAWNQKSDGTVMLTCLSTNGVPFTGNDGVLVSLELTAQESLSVDSHLAGQLTGVTFVTPEGVQRDIDDVDISITIEDYILGDVNGNGGVDIGDAVSIVNYLVGKESTKFVEKAADTNKNGKVDIGDAVTIVNFLVGKTATLSRTIDIGADRSEPLREREPQ